MYPKLEASLRELAQEQPSEERRSVLQPLVKYGLEKRGAGKLVRLNFICTHNSRRSQFAQLWAAAAAEWFGVKAKCFSGGVEVTEFNATALATLEQAGFKVQRPAGRNPRYLLRYAEEKPTIEAYSKLYDAAGNPEYNFAAIMTCSHADVNCPFIPGAEKRIALNYEDPKKYDGTANEVEAYRERSRQIAIEMIYVFSKISS